ncbi:hypothetical protein EVAR_92581_1 [Eumeta japonica]|uniref:Uncharacterized protein n=1 Tax=Eumeta variegata TaxID=151549 RepID=A0A4C1SWN5_EUMVA|nr:hypothetical protein EVAR_92581_1 [Eumeta japonica]
MDSEAVTLYKVALPEVVGALSPRCELVLTFRIIVRVKCIKVTSCVRRAPPAARADGQPVAADADLKPPAAQDAAATVPGEWSYANSTIDASATIAVRRYMSSDTRHMLHAPQTTRGPRPLAPDGARAERAADLNPALASSKAMHRALGPR